MTEVEKVETKTKILSVASDLFSKFGFNGTSIRDIAQASDVNVAAVNYHFGSKSNLYWEVINSTHCQGSEAIKNIAMESHNIEEFVLNVFDYLLKEQSSIRTAIRIMMTEGVPEPDNHIKEAMKAKMGPPGSEEFEKMLNKELGQTVSPQAVLFAARSIFNHLMHMVMIRISSKRELLETYTPEFNLEAMQVHLKHHTRAICEYVRNHQEKI